MKFSLVALFAASAIAAPHFGGGKGKSATGLPTAWPTGWPTGLPGIPSGAPTGGSGFPFPTGGFGSFGGGEDEDGPLFNAGEDAPARPTPTGKGKGGKGKGTGLPGWPTAPGWPTGLPTGAFPTGIPGFPTGPGGPFPTGRPDDDE